MKSNTVRVLPEADSSEPADVWLYADPKSAEPT